MKKLLLLLTVSTFTFMSCGDDDVKGENPTPVNPVPVNPTPGKDTKTKPKFTSSATVSVDENQISALTLVASDEDKDKLTYSISGADASSFTVNGSTGVVVFKVAPVYAKKSSYTFTATVSDGTNNVVQTVIVKIKAAAVVAKFTPKSKKEIQDKVAEYNKAFTADSISGNTLALKKQIEKADVTNVTDMSKLFKNSTFNLDIRSWDTSKVTSMASMFLDNVVFNQDISGWNTSSVTTMNTMFLGATAFNQKIGTWNTANVEDMSSMFQDTKAFNQKIGTWNTSKVTKMFAMFRNTKEFNQDIGAWNTSKVVDMKEMFYLAISFNQDISRWNVKGKPAHDDFDTNTHPFWKKSHKPVW